MASRRRRRRWPWQRRRSGSRLRQSAGARRSRAKRRLRPGHSRPAERSIAGRHRPQRSAHLSRIAVQVRRPVTGRAGEKPSADQSLKRARKRRPAFAAGLRYMSRNRKVRLRASSTKVVDRRERVLHVIEHVCLDDLIRCGRITSTVDDFHHRLRSGPILIERGPIRMVSAERPRDGRKASLCRWGRSRAARVLRAGTTTPYRPIGQTFSSRSASPARACSSRWCR